MPKGLKQSSSVVSIGFSLTESAANTFTQSSVDLNLSPLDREVFVVLAANLDASFPDCITATDTQTRAGLTTTSQTAMPNLSNSNCLVRLTEAIRTDAVNAVSFTTAALETPPATLLLQVGKKVQVLRELVLVLVVLEAQEDKRRQPWTYKKQ